VQWTLFQCFVLMLVTRCASQEISVLDVLRVTNPSASDYYFGDSVSSSRDTVVVGSPSEEISSGAVYVFVRDGTNWTEQAHLATFETEVNLAIQ
jgi:hypothetical protein